MPVRSIADSLGIFGSALCALHCALVPSLLVAGFALPTALLSDELFHRLALIVVVPVALLALTLGCRRHRNRGVLLLGILGLGGIIGSSVLPHAWLGETWERVAMLAGSLLLIAAHLRNVRLCRRGGCVEQPG
ncbi:MAG: MerC domain-containing protein [Pseudomonadota bacterium]